MRRQIALFIVSCFLGGAGALIGSIIGNAAGKAGLFIGAIVGGLLGSVASAHVARRRGWISPQRVLRTSFGAAAGFIVAAAIATQTLSSPVGPLLSTALIGVGALLGAGTERDRASNEV